MVKLIEQIETQSLRLSVQGKTRYLFTKSFYTSLQKPSNNLSTKQRNIFPQNLSTSNCRKLQINCLRNNTISFHRIFLCPAAETFKYHAQRRTCLFHRIVQSHFSNDLLKAHFAPQPGPTKTAPLWSIATERETSMQFIWCRRLHGIACLHALLEVAMRAVIYFAVLDTCSLGHIPSWTKQPARRRCSRVRTLMGTALQWVWTVCQ